MKYLVAFFCIWGVLLTVWSCEPKEEIVTRNPKASLQFSTDSVQFDTVLVNPLIKNPSVTRRLTVFNFNKNAVEIDEIKLGKLTASNYTVLINGQATPLASKVRILGEDSLLILVRVAIAPDAKDEPFKVLDDLTFRLNNEVQTIKLVATGQNVNYYQNQVLDCNTTWTAQRPHLIYGKVTINPTCQLIIEKGTRIYLHQNALLEVQGSLQVNGQAAKKDRVVFDGDRLERFYDDIPGQWQGIRFTATSQNNILRYADINNAHTGIFTQFPDRSNSGGFGLRLENCKINNMITAGIRSHGSDIQAINTLINHCGQYAVAGFGGGTYSFKYCTIANFSTNFRRDTPSFYFTDRLPPEDGGPLVGPVKISMVNSIIWAGRRNNRYTEEIGFLTTGSTAPVLDFRNNLLQTEQNRNMLAGQNNLFNEDPVFRSSPAAARVVYPLNFALGADSPLLNKGLPLPDVKTDIEDKPRDPATPDIGAYERP